jgi:hypothetical protein
MTYSTSAYPTSGPGDPASRVAAGANLPPRGTAHESAPAAVTSDDEAEYVAADVRSQAIERMRRFSVRHGTSAWELRRRDPLAPYGMAFLYLSPSPLRPRRFALAAATRLWLADPKIVDLPTLVFEFTQRVEALPGPVDMRSELADLVDDMPDDAFYAGIAVSSLDTWDGSWLEVCQRGDGPDNIPGRNIICLTDRTIIVCERRGRRHFNDFQIYTNHSLEVAPARAIYTYQQVAAERLRGTEDDDNVRQLPRRVDDDKYTIGFVEKLNELLWSIDNQRLAARAGQR